MREESVMKVGRKRHKMTGYFPPTPSDPYLRLVFPRAAPASEKTIVFELYLPGQGNPFRQAEYLLKEMTVGGRLEL
ncbi:MAG: hypothetical protein ACRD96_14260, partial [Bryobacteraceae bacterium]